MNEEESCELTLDVNDSFDIPSLPGVIVSLGELKPGTIVTEAGLAQLFKRHIVSVKRAVERGELPPPCRLFGARVWTAGALIRYIEQRLEDVAQQAARDAQRVRERSPLPSISRRV